MYQSLNPTKVVSDCKYFFITFDKRTDNVTAKNKITLEIFIMQVKNTKKHKPKNILQILLLTIFFICVLSCSEFFHNNPIKSVGIYSGVYYSLMNSVNNEDINGIEKVFKKNNLNLNYADPLNGVSLLNWCIMNRKYKSFEKLLALGANPNWQDSGCKLASPIIEAAKVSDTSFYLYLAFKYGGNANQLAKNMRGPEDQTTLMGAISSYRFESVKTVVQHGADVNLTQNNLWTPLAEALIQDKMEIAKYLLDRGADFNNLKFWSQVSVVHENNQQVHDSSGSPIFKNGVQINILDLLRENQMELNSGDYVIKMQIVEFLKAKGLDYKNYPIPDDVKKQHLNDPEYLSKY